jgi:hypothetical protein
MAALSRHRLLLCSSGTTKDTPIVNATSQVYLWRALMYVYAGEHSPTVTFFHDLVDTLLDLI